jgi:hypothetical protein
MEPTEAEPTPTRTDDPPAEAADLASGAAGDARPWRFGIADLMIASLAVAVTLNLSVSERAALANTVGHTFQDLLPGFSMYAIARRGAPPIGPMVVMFTLGALMAAPPAILLLGLRRRSKPLRAFLLRPGPIACVGGVLGLADSILLGSYRLLFAQMVIPSCIAAGWAALAVTGRWRPPTDGLDRAGRVLGKAWIFVGLVLLGGMIRVGGHFHWLD